MKKLLLTGESSSHDEAFLQELAFENPQYLPVADIDPVAGAEVGINDAVTGIAIAT